jgi:hypothetical protein
MPPITINHDIISIKAMRRNVNEPGTFDEVQVTISNQLR